ncbi:chemotaxis protein [Mycobacterium intracellulare subsp. yongonense]|nr:chemotaxis protein [Mycobacterium intracellulare subsp. yongonense]
MSGRAGSADFVQWANAALAGTGWTVATVREAAQRGRADLATAALADGFAAAARGLADAGECRDGAA